MKQWEKDFLEYAKARQCNHYNMWKRFADNGVCVGLDCNFCPYLGKCLDADFKKELNKVVD